MAETFSNYLFNGTMNPGQTQVVVPVANSSKASDLVQTRTINAVSQVHSIYITKEHNTKTTDVEKEGVYIHLYIEDDGERFYIGHNICVLPYSSFYIEKTITLLSTQSLNMEYSTLNTESAKLNCVCSCVDVVD